MKFLTYARFLLAFIVIHFVGMATYIATVDELYCQGDFNENFENDCYGWKATAGIWEVILLQELVIRPIVREIKE